MGSVVSKTINKWFHKSNDSQEKKSSTTDDNLSTHSTSTDGSSDIPNSEESSHEQSNTESESLDSTENSIHSSDENGQSSEKPVSPHSWSEITQHPLIEHSTSTETLIEKDESTDDIGGQIEEPITKSSGNDPIAKNIPKAVIVDDTVKTSDIDKKSTSENHNLQTVSVEASVEQSNNKLTKSISLDHSTKLFSAYVEENTLNDPESKSSFTVVGEKIYVPKESIDKSKVTTFENWNPKSTYTLYDLRNNNKKRHSTVRKFQKNHKGSIKTVYNINKKVQKIRDSLALVNYSNFDKNMKTTNNSQQSINKMKIDTLSDKIQVNTLTDKMQVDTPVDEEFVKQSNTIHTASLTSERRGMDTIVRRPTKQDDFPNKTTNFDYLSSSKPKMFQQPPKSSLNTPIEKGPTQEIYTSQYPITHREQQSLNNRMENQWLHTKNNSNDGFEMHKNNDPEPLKQTLSTTKDPSIVDGAYNIQNPAKRNVVSTEQNTENFSRKDTTIRVNNGEPKQSRNFSWPQYRRLNNGEGFIMYGKNQYRPFYQPSYIKKGPVFTDTPHPIYHPNQTYDPSQPSNRPPYFYKDDKLYTENCGSNPWFNDPQFRHDTNIYNDPQNLKNSQFTENLPPYGYRPQPVNTQYYNRVQNWPQHPNPNYRNIADRRYTPRSPSSPWHQNTNFGNFDEYEIPPEM